MNQETSNLMKSVNKTRSPNRFVEYQRIETPENSIPLIVISGTYYDKGYEYGKALGKEIAKNIQANKRYVLKGGIGPANARASPEEWDLKRNTLFSNVPSHFLDEIQGVVDGSKENEGVIITPNDLMDVVLVVEIKEQMCAMFALQPPATKKHTFQLRNVDYPLDIGAQENPVITVYIPQDSNGNYYGNSYANIGVAGYLGIVTGINQKGITLSEVAAPYIQDPVPPSLNGRPFFYIMEDILLNANTATEALDILRSSRRTFRDYYIISDPLQKRESGILIFAGPSVMKYWFMGDAIDTSIIKNKTKSFYEPIEGGVYWMEMEGGGLDAGPEFVYKPIKDSLGTIGTQEALNIAKSVGSQSTLMSIVFNSSTLEAWVSYTKGDKLAHDLPYIKIDLERYFSMKFLPEKRRE